MPNARTNLSKRWMGNFLSDQPPYATVTYTMCRCYGSMFITWVHASERFQELFKLFILDGSLVSVDEFRQLITSENDYNSAEISQNEHPVYGIAYYNLHPCRTAVLMKELRTSNHVLRFCGSV